MKSISVLFAGLALCLVSWLPAGATVLSAKTSAVATPAETTSGGPVATRLSDGVTPPPSATAADVSLLGPVLPDFGMAHGFIDHTAAVTAAPRKLVHFDGMDFPAADQTTNGTVGSPRMSKLKVVERSGLVLVGLGLTGFAISLRRRVGVRPAMPRNGAGRGRIQHPIRS